MKIVPWLVVAIMVATCVINQLTINNWKRAANTWEATARDALAAENRARAAAAEWKAACHLFHVAVMGKPHAECAERE